MPEHAARRAFTHMRDRDQSFTSRPAGSHAALARAVVEALDDPAFAAAFENERGRPGRPVAITLGEPLLTAAQVGELLGGVPAKSVLAYAASGRLPSRRIGRHVRFLRAEIANALAVKREL